MKLSEITDTDVMRSTINRGLMVQWINADLIARASCDVRYSVVLYDADGMFVGAIGASITRDDFARLTIVHDQLIDAGVRYYSIGVK